MKYINLTGSLLLIQSEVCRYPLSSKRLPARILKTHSHREFLSFHEGEKIVVIAESEKVIVDLPNPIAETVYLVTREVFDMVNGRQDVLTPDFGETAIRDDKGTVVCVTRFIGKHI